MNDVIKNRIILISLVAASVIFLLVAVSFYLQEKAERGEKESANKISEELKKNKIELTEKLDRLERQRQDLESRVSEADGGLKNISAQLESERERASADIAKREDEIKTLKEQAAAYQKENKKISAERTSLEREYNKLNGQLDAMAAAKKEGEEKVKSLEKRLTNIAAERKSTSLGTIVIRKQ